MKSRTKSVYKIKSKLLTKKTKKKQLTEKQLTDKQFMKLEYPYRELSINENQMKDDFKQLQEFYPIILNINPSKIRIKPYKKNYVVFLENYHKYKEMHQITDYFSHKCRVRCIFNLKENKSILDLFNQNKKQILKNFKKYKQKLTLYNISEYIWKSKYRLCTTFNTTIVVSVLKYFKSKRMLDFSAGWGDRLIGAIACEIEYTGVDPSNCMAPIYQKIINTLVNKENRIHYKMIQDGFENVELKSNQYDLVFTSPPFFNMEIYENNNSQSIEKFKSVKAWSKGFLHPSLKKSYKYLIVEGILALYITDSKSTNYVYNMKQYIKYNIKGLKYQGDLHWYEQDNPKTIRQIFVWKKIY